MTKILSLLLLLMLSAPGKPAASITTLDIPESESAVWGQHISSELYTTQTAEEAEAFRSLLCALELESVGSEAEVNILYAIDLTLSSDTGDSFRFSIDPSGLVWLNGNIEELYRVVNHENLYQELFELTPLALEP